MRRFAAIAASMAALAFASVDALAFQEMPAPSPAEASEGAPQNVPPVDPLQLGTPGTAAAAQKSDRGGLKLFRYTLMPMLNFGLDVLYGQDQQQLQLQGQRAPNLLEENGDVSVLGKVKRRF
jgi:hypothetical protein